MQMTIRIPDEYKEKIRILAQRMGLKRSDIARLALRKFIDENINDDPSTPYEKVKGLIGTAESGVKDLGRRHREHLARKIRKAP